MSKGQGQALKQAIYYHGGSRIYLEKPDGERTLIADTYGYGGKEYAESVFRFTEEWLKSKNGAIPSPELPQRSPESK